MELIKNLAYDRKAGFDVQKLISYIETGYEAKRRKTGKYKKTTFSPSQVAYGSGRCARRWVMSFRGEWENVDNNSAASLAVMDQGQGAHQRIQDALRVAGVVLEEELEVRSEDPPIRGFVDNIVEIDGVKVVVEIKTTRMEAFEPKIYSMKAAYYHMYQLLIYMKVLGIKNGAFIYENKNDNSLLVIPVTLDEFNDKVVTKSLDWMKNVWNVYESGALPTRPWKKTSQNCSGCPLFDACWDVAGPGDIDVKPMSVYKW